MEKVYYIRHPWHGFWTGMYLITGNDGHILVDSAFENAITDTLEPFLKNIGSSLDSIKYVINTHAHGDHVEGNAKLRELTPAKFGIFHTGAESLRHSGFEPDILLYDDMTLDWCGSSIKIIHTPGHSDDSICILEQTTGTLMTGDSIQGKGSLNIGLALYQNPAEYRKSLLKIKELCLAKKIRRIMLGHPELPARSGVVEEPEVLSYINDSILTVDNYTKTAQELIRENPKADRALLRNRLLELYGVDKNPSWPELSYGTAGAYLK